MRYDSLDVLQAEGTVTHMLFNRPEVRPDGLR